jgi:hypothetical protein
MRAVRARYNPYDQARGRIDQLKSLGHSVDKVEYIIMGGTFMSLRVSYSFKLYPLILKLIFCRKITVTGSYQICMMLCLVIQAMMWMRLLDSLNSRKQSVLELLLKHVLIGA